MSWFDFLDEINEPELIQYLEGTPAYMSMNPLTAGAEEE